MIKYLQASGTHQNFTEMLDRKPRALHISCHGEQEPNLEYYLILETPEAEGIKLTRKEICNMLSVPVTLDFVFVAACKSQNLGDMFLQAGVQHVICVKKQAYIADEAVLRFTNRFYQNVFRDGTRICEAFEKARNDVKTLVSKGQADMFKILVQDSDETNHVCKEFKLQKAVSDDQKWCDISDKADIRLIPSSQELEGRQEVLQQIIKNFVDPNTRVLVLAGVPGVGKAALTIEMLHYFDIRNMFKGGIVMIRKDEIHKVPDLIQVLIRKLLNDTSIINERKKQEILQNCRETPENLMDDLIWYFKQKTEIKTKKGGLLGNKNPGFLLALDHVEEIIHT